MNLLVIAGALTVGQTPPNLDFSAGSLDRWQGQGFAFVAAQDGQPAAASSADEGSPSRKGMLRYALYVPEGARQIVFQAYADVRGDNEPDATLNVVLAGADNVPLPRLIRGSDGSWNESSQIRLPHLGKPRTYAWDVGPHQGKLMQIVLIDNDDRPGHFVWAGAFQVQGAKTVAAEILDPDFGPLMLDLQKKNSLNPMSRFDSKHFTAISNASEKFTTERLRNCEVFYDLFLNHFKGRGFPVYPPTQRLMIAVFDTHKGFDSYFGQKMPSGIAGVYHTATNRLVLYDFAENRMILANKEAALKQGATITNSLVKAKFVDSVERKLSNVTKDANLSTTMHECAHQISFNCGLLNRKGDVPASIAEGLATYCEATDQGDWTSLGNRNPMRIAELTRARGRFIPLADLVKNEKWLGTPNVLLGYSQSWALFHMLMHRRPAELQKYFKIIAERRTPESRLDDFQTAFGPFATFDRQYQAYLDDLTRSR